MHGYRVLEQKLNIYKNNQKTDEWITSQFSNEYYGDYFSQNTSIYHCPHPEYWGAHRDVLINVVGLIVGQVKLGWIVVHICHFDGQL